MKRPSKKTTVRFRKEFDSLGNDMADVIIIETDTQVSADFISNELSKILGVRPAQSGKAPNILLGYKLIDLPEESRHEKLH